MYVYLFSASYKILVECKDNTEDGHHQKLAASYRRVATRR